MSTRPTRSRRLSALLAVALLSVSLVAATGAFGPEAAAARPSPKPKPTPTATPTPTPTATPTPTPVPTATPTPAPACSVTGSVTPSPNGTVLSNWLNDAEAIASDDIWAAGSFGSPFMHWDGASWSLVADPNTGKGDQFFGVAAAASDDVWAVGTYSDQVGFSQAIAEHWDGTRWSVVPGTEFGTTSRLMDVAVLAPDDVWAVGSYSSEATDHWAQPLVEHWDGSELSVVPSPSIGTSSELEGVAALATNDIWAVGTTYTGGGHYQTLVLHWDGNDWTRIPSPNVGPYGNGLTAISAVDANDIWAVGNGNNSSVSLILHWDGSEWSVVPSPNSGHENNLLAGVAARAADDVWAVGYSIFWIPVGEDFEAHFRSLLMHWDGKTWSLFDSAAPNTEDNARYGVDTLPDGEAWVVGGHNAFDGTVIERYRCQ
jgi:hypothetical protein